MEILAETEKDRNIKWTQLHSRRHRDTETQREAGRHTETHKGT